VSVLLGVAETLAGNESVSGRIYSEEVHRAWRRRLPEQTKKLGALWAVRWEADMQAVEEKVQRIRRHRLSVRRPRHGDH
jgi:hypothetical protein